MLPPRPTASQPAPFRGDDHLGAGRLDAACADYDRALSLCPTDLCLRLRSRRVAQAFATADVKPQPRPPTIAGNTYRWQRGLSADATALPLEGGLFSVRLLEPPEAQEHPVDRYGCAAALLTNLALSVAVSAGALGPRWLLGWPLAGLLLLLVELVARHRSHRLLSRLVDAQQRRLGLETLPDAARSGTSTDGFRRAVRDPRGRCWQLDATIDVSLTPAQAEMTLERFDPADPLAPAAPEPPPAPTSGEHRVERET